MTGTCTKRVSKSGGISYLLRIDLGVFNGVRKRHVETFHGSKKDASAKLRDLIRQFEQGTLAQQAASMTVDQFFEKWLSESAVHGRKIRTVQEYRGNFERYIKSKPNMKKCLGSYPLDKVTPLQIQEFVNQLALRLSPQSVRNIMTVLKVGFKQARKWRYISISPVHEIELPRKNDAPTMKAMDGDQIPAFFEAAHGHPREVVFQTALATGCRPQEYLAFKWTDLDLLAGLIRVERSITWPLGGGWVLQTTKTAKSRRTIPLPVELLPLLRRHKALQAQERLVAGPEWPDHDFIFTNQHGGPLDRGDLSRVFRRICNAAKLPKGFHLYHLRHTCATVMLSGGINPKVAAERLGHSTVNLTLDTYSSVLPTMQAEATQQIGSAMFRKNPRLKIAE